MNTKLSLALCILFWSLVGSAQNNPNYVDFETGTYSGGHTAGPENSNINNAYFHSAYGVEFFNVLSGTQYIPKYATVGPNAAAFKTSNVNATYCYSGSTTDDNPYNSATNPGCWFMTDDDGIVTQNPKQLHIEYDQDSIQCTIASGYVYDLDGNSMAEAWRLDIYSVGGGGTPDNSIYIISDQYASCSGCPALPGPMSGAYNWNGGSILAGDGRDTYWELQTNGNPIDYITMTYIGHPNRGVGVAFDNFYYCSKGDSTPPQGDPCDSLEAKYTYAVNGCGVQFTDQSTSASGYPIIGWHWDFGDGTTSNQQNPFHQYAPNNTYTATLYVTSFNGEECCTDSIKQEIRVNECRDCEAEIDFSWTFNEYCDPCLMDFSPIIHYQTTAVIGYYWNINGTIYTTENVQHLLSGGASVCLTVIFEGPNGKPGECCTRTICAEVECGTVGTASGGEPAGMMPDMTHDDESTMNIDGASDLEDHPEFSAKIYPNPGNAEISIDLEMLNSDEVSVVLISPNGQRIELMDQVALTAGSNQLTINTSDVAEGMYILRIDGNQIAFSDRLQIQH
ncbi:T9SS type A sorting domain-containing protein [bacterium SCSIO 12741]|nr:T9SS type A sorting domain-containing protein [bacterium SCSIO 12741]